MKNTFQKTLLYNLVLFNFILLEVSTKKICNFFFEKYTNNFSKKKIFKITTSALLLAFKRLFRFLFFFKRIKKNKLISFFGTDVILEILKSVCKQFKLECFLSFNSYAVLNSSSLLKTLIFFDLPITQTKLLAFFFKKNYFLYAFDSFNDSLHFNLFKIFTTLEDQKKIIFLGLIFMSLFKR